MIPTDQRLFTVGRLDKSSEGLILVTNDGEFANRITHPRYGVEKTYAVRVAGAADPKQLARLKRGVHLAEGFAKAQAITVKKKHGRSTDLVIVLNEGRNREVRRILARVGHKVLALKRVAVGPIKLADLPVGGWRRLMPAEVEQLLSVAKEKRRAGKKGSGFGVQGSGKKSKQEQPYLQKEALLSEPLSLDDLLRDDLEEAVVEPLPAESDEEGSLEAGARPVRGDVIDYPDEGRRPGAAPRERTGRGPFQKRAGQKRGKPGFRAKHTKTGKNFQHKQRRGKPGGKPGGKGKGRRR
jgi:23S rRNA pseudouridine2605 synthase